MKTFLPLAFLLLLTTAVQAETIHLKDGRSLTGKIIQKDTKSLKIEINGVAMTYYADDIKDVDGVPMRVEEPKVVMKTPSKANTTDKKALILKFIDVFGTRNAMERNFEVLLNSLAQQKPEEAQKIREKFKIDEVIEKLIPLYDKHFTIEDLQAYIDFYGSDKGKKLIGSIGEIMNESVEVGTEYLKDKFPEIDQN